MFRMDTMEEIDFDELFAHRGGFAFAYAKLLAYAVHVIQKRQSNTPNGRVISQLDKAEIVAHAFSRLVDCEFLHDGEAVYLQLRRHIDNHVRGLQKLIRPLVIKAIDPASDPADSLTVSDIVDHNSEREALHTVEERNFYETVIDETQKQYPKGSVEYRLIEALLEGWSKPADVAELLELSMDEYNNIYRRVCRKAATVKGTLIEKQQGGSYGGRR